ncbi:MAG TPA: DinB family protein [Homoserinimonas sp.]|nr:DinB family protein [Homoserinimonas sp.]
MDAVEPSTVTTLAGYARARIELRELLADATPADLRRRTIGTRWTNEQMLFHLVFGYMIVQALIPLVRVVSRLPRPFQRGFAALLNAGTAPFDVVNYWGSRFAATYFNHNRMAAKLDRVLDSLARTLTRAPEARLRRTMRFPDRWDPFFEPEMSIAEVYAYPTKHFDFHRRQLSL